MVDDPGIAGRVLRAVDPVELRSSAEIADTSGVTTVMTLAALRGLLEADLVCRFTQPGSGDRWWLSPDGVRALGEAS